MILTLEEVKAKKAEVLIEGVNSFLGTCLGFSHEYFVRAGIVQVFGGGYYESVDRFIEEYLPLFPEEEIWEAFDSADVHECNECGWWCDDVHHESPDTPGQPVCSECNENHHCEECGCYPCEC